MATDYTNMIFGTIRAERPATAQDLARYVTRTEVVRWTPWRGQGTKMLKRVAGNRNRYWYCVCTACDRVHVVRSDHLRGKRCRCQKTMNAYVCTRLMKKYRVAGEIEQRRCPTCGQWKSADDFYKNSAALDGLCSECKTCRGERQKTLRNRGPSV